MSDPVSYLTSRFKEFGFQLTQRQAEQFVGYYDLLIQRNRSVNLTAITDWEEVVDKHFIDSIMLLSALPDLTEKRSDLLDVGTGAGFPGIPLKIMCPDLHVTLLDSLDKRIIFLEDVISFLRLDHIRAIHGRAEELSRLSEHREKYDLVVSRAVSDFSMLTEFCIPFVKIGGDFAAYKTVHNLEEADLSSNAFDILGCEYETSCRFTYSILSSDFDRMILLSRKISATPDKYPRRMSAIRNKPLLK